MPTVVPRGRPTGRLTMTSFMRRFYFKMPSLGNDLILATAIVFLRA